MFCTHCGSGNSEEALFCQKCGKQLEATNNDSPTLLASPPISAPPYESSPFTTYGPSEPIYPPPPPVEPPYSALNPYEIGPSTRTSSNRKYLIIITILVVMLVGGGVFVGILLGKGNSQVNTGHTPGIAKTIAPPTPTQIPATQVAVQADSDWQSSGVFVSQGTVVKIEYVSGYWRPWPGVNFDGTGCTQGCSLSNDLILVGCNHGGLIGRIGSTHMICVLDGTTVTAPESGMLYLRINDPVISDDSGAINVQITLG